MTLRVRINPIACTGHGMCAELFPELIELDDWGYPIVKNDGLVPHELEAHAERAAEYCPTLAVLLERVRTGDRPSRRLAARG
jgi:ferredoxin